MTKDRAPLLMACLVVLAAALMVALPARVLECDAVIYACAGLHGDTVQNTDAGHLAWGGVEWLAADAGRLFQPPLNPIFLLRWLSMAAALAGSWLLFHLLRDRLLISGIMAALLSALLLFSYSYWHFGLDAEPHALQILVLIAFLLVARTFLERPGPGGARVTGLTLGVATLLHQTTILFAPLVLLALWPATGRDRRTWGKYAAWFTGTYVLAAVVPYLIVGWFVRDLRTVADFKQWIMGISTWGYWGKWRVTSFAASLVGVVRSLTGSHYLLGIGPIRDLAQRLFPAASWSDEILLARTIPDWVRLALLPLQAGVLAGWVYLIVRGFGGLRRGWRTHSAFALLLTTWLVVHFLFFTWWAPERAEFWTGFWLPFIVLLAPGLQAIGSGIRIPALVLAGLILVNLIGSIAPQAADLELTVTAMVAIDPVTRPGDVLLSDHPLNYRAGDYVYTVDKVSLPNHAGRAAAVVDSLLQAVEARANTLYWVGWGQEVPPEVLFWGQPGAPVPVRAPVMVVPLTSRDQAEAED